MATPPFSDADVAGMVHWFRRNLNINGTGATMASPGDVPALNNCCPGGYRYSWTRDSGLTMVALQHTRSVTNISSADLTSTLNAYVHWVKRKADLGPSVQTEPKWNISTGLPYEGGWCRPQSDGPGIRANAVLTYSSLFGVEQVDGISLWDLAKYDLDWIARPGGFDEESCDLWEETVDTNFLWNRVTMREALLTGAAFAEAHGDATRAAQYRAFAQDAQRGVGAPFGAHLKAESDGGYFTECPASGGGDACRTYDKQIDGAVILALVHGPASVADGAEFGPLGFAGLAVARTVATYNQAFCGAYAVNQGDTSRGVPGILYGRYLKDQYGGGNPWVLVTAALAGLLYRAAQALQGGVVLPAAELAAWRSALGPDFGGTRDAFVGAGDAVLVRLRSHVSTGDRLHLFEQIDRSSGAQYNAQDLTWSYAEVFVAYLLATAAT